MANNCATSASARTQLLKNTCGYYTESRYVILFRAFAHLQFEEKLVPLGYNQLHFISGILSRNRLVNGTGIAMEMTKEETNFKK